MKLRKKGNIKGGDGITGEARYKGDEIKGISFMGGAPPSEGSLEQDGEERGSKVERFLRSEMHRCGGLH